MSPRGAALALLAGALAFAPARPGAASPRLDWILNCQGCHLPDGTGAPGRVPSLVGSVGRFVALPEGRAFLVQVPGVAQSALDDAALAALLNWMLARFSPGELPADFAPYTAAEVARHRTRPLSDVDRRRAEILERLAPAQQGPRP